MNVELKRKKRKALLLINLFQQPIHFEFYNLEHFAQLKKFIYC